jgi:hypothetical protein
MYCLNQIYMYKPVCITDFILESEVHSVSACNNTIHTQLYYPLCSLSIKSATAKIPSENLQLQQNVYAVTSVSMTWVCKSKICCFNLGK